MSELSNNSSMLAWLTSLLDDEPENMTSSIVSPRKFRADDSPITHLIASIILDLPHPFGPTIPVRLLGKFREVESTNVLKPDNFILDNLI